MKCDETRMHLIECIQHQPQLHNTNFKFSCQMVLHTIMKLLKCWETQHCILTGSSFPYAKPHPLLSYHSIHSTCLQINSLSQTGNMAHLPNIHFMRSPLHEIYMILNWNGGFDHIQVIPPKTCPAESIFIYFDVLMSHMLI